MRSNRDGLSALALLAALRLDDHWVNDRSSETRCARVRCAARHEVDLRVADGQGDVGCPGADYPDAVDPDVIDSVGALVTAIEYLGACLAASDRARGEDDRRGIEDCPVDALRQHCLASRCFYHHGFDHRGIDRHDLDRDFDGHCFDWRCFAFRYAHWPSNRRAEQGDYCCRELHAVLVRTMCVAAEGRVASSLRDRPADLYRACAIDWRSTAVLTYLRDPARSRVKRRVRANRACRHRE